MSHFFFIEEANMNLISDLFANRINDQYVILNQNNGYSDIVQYSEKYQNVKVVTVMTRNLDPKMAL